MLQFGSILRKKYFWFLLSAACVIVLFVFSPATPQVQEAELRRLRRQAVSAYRPITLFVEEQMRQIQTSQGELGSWSASSFGIA